MLVEVSCYPKSICCTDVVNGALVTYAPSKPTNLDGVSLTPVTPGNYEVGDSTTNVYVGPGGVVTDSSPVLSTGGLASLYRPVNSVYNYPVNVGGLVGYDVADSSATAVVGPGGSSADSSAVVSNGPLVRPVNGLLGVLPADASTVVNDVSYPYLPASPLSYQPGNVGYQTGYTSYQPANPSYQPVNPSYQSGNPSYQPGSLNYQPGGLNYQPGSLNYQPGYQGYVPGSSGYYNTEVPSGLSALTDASPVGGGNSYLLNYLPGSQSYQPGYSSYSTDVNSGSPAVPDVNPLVNGGYTNYQQLPTSYVGYPQEVVQPSYLGYYPQGQGSVSADVNALVNPGYSNYQYQPGYYPGYVPPYSGVDTKPVLNYGYSQYQPYTGYGPDSATALANALAKENSYSLGSLPVSNQVLAEAEAQALAYGNGYYNNLGGLNVAGYPGRLKGYGVGSPSLVQSNANAMASAVSSIKSANPEDQSGELDDAVTQDS